MKAIAIAGSARKYGSGAQLLKKALEGAKDGGCTETKLIFLSDLKYKGCRGCQECKRIGSPTYGQCAIQDDLTPVLEEIRQADILFFGAAMYYVEIPGRMLSFFERMLYPCHVYESMANRRKMAGKYPSGIGCPTGPTLWPRTTHTAFFYTMNIGKMWWQDSGLRSLLNEIDQACHTSTELHLITETLQYFNGYDQYYAPKRDGDYRKKRYDTTFQIELEEAYLTGKRLATEPPQTGNAYSFFHYQQLNELLGSDYYDVPEDPGAEPNPGFKFRGLPNPAYPTLEEYTYNGKVFENGVKLT